MCMVTCIVESPPMSIKESNKPINFPWNAALIGTFPPNMELPNFLPINALAVFLQRNSQACAAASAAAFEGAQAITRQQLKLIQQIFARTTEGINLLASGDASELMTAKQAELAKKAYQQAVTNTRDLRDLALRTNMQALDFLHGRFAESMDEIRAFANDKIRAAKISKQPELTNRTYKSAATDAWQRYSQAQNAGLQAWESLYKRLEEGVSEMNAQGGFSAPEARAEEPTDALKEVHKRSAADTQKLCDLMRKSNTTALELLQKRFAEAMKETAPHLSAAQIKRQEGLIKETFERAASDTRNMFEALQRANAEALEVLRGQLAQSMNAARGHGQKAA
jgi:phasin family protein